MNRRIVTAALVLVNLILLACLVITAYTPPAAMAQAVPRAGEYILISAEAARVNDAVYLVDLSRRQMHAFRAAIPNVVGQPVRVAWQDSRDLVRDFRR